MVLDTLLAKTDVRRYKTKYKSKPMARALQNMNWQLSRVKLDTHLVKLYIS